MKYKSLIAAALIVGMGSGGIAQATTYYGAVPPEARPSSFYHRSIHQALSIAGFHHPILLQLFWNPVAIVPAIPIHRIPIPVPQPCCHPGPPEQPPPDHTMPTFPTNPNLPPHLAQPYSTQ